jgi:uncharacterized protein (DUF1697 family)
MTYVALLRGINVGGNRKVGMAKLATVFERLGFTQVKTFIASGNVIFCSSMKERLKLIITIEAALEWEFGFSIPVLLRDLNEIAELVKDVPAAWVNDATMKCDVLFLQPEIDSPKILEQISRNPNIEDVIYLPGAVVWRIDRANVKPGRVLKIIGANVHKQLTVRNPNTIRKIYKLMLTTDSVSET